MAEFADFCSKVPYNNLICHFLIDSCDSCVFEALSNFLNFYSEADVERYIEGDTQVGCVGVGALFGRISKWKLWDIGPQVGVQLDGT